ncbi:hypothetical protein HDU97_003356 [Phlyctochytrium planicorne]|nr:hypothetical protein HDU97_003356 [Phlyctochytrium planicorne]
MTLESIKEKIKGSYWYTYITLGRYTKRRAPKKSNSLPNLRIPTTSSQSSGYTPGKVHQPLRLSSTPNSSIFILEDDASAASSPTLAPSITFPNATPSHLKLSSSASYKEAASSAPSSPVSLNSPVFPSLLRVKKLTKYRSMSDLAQDSGVDLDAGEVQTWVEKKGYDFPVKAPTVERTVEKKKSWLGASKKDPEYVRSSEAYNSLKNVPYASV